jgi:hypothetical protein
MKWARPLAIGGLLLLSLPSAEVTVASPVADCTGEAAALAKDQSDLPRLEIANPADRPPYCITLETLIAFAARVKAHAAACPNSDFVHQVAEWDKSRANHSRLFSQYRCRRTM